jgi:glutathione S-transferase
MIDLYYMPGSAAMAPHAVLEEAGADYRLIRVTREDGRVDPPGFVGLSPHGRVPVLADGQLVLHESAAIVMHLSDAFPEAGLAPALGTPERAHWYRWLTYLTNTVQPAFLGFLHPERYIADAAGVPAVKEQSAVALAGMRDFLAGALAARGPYLLGERFTSADPFLYMLTRWGRRLESKWWDQPDIGAHYRLLGERPAIQRMREQEGLDDAT